MQRRQSSINSIDFRILFQKNANRIVINGNKLSRLCPEGRRWKLIDLFRLFSSIPLNRQGIAKVVKIPLDWHFGLRQKKTLVKWFQHRSFKRFVARSFISNDNDSFLSLFHFTMANLCSFLFVWNYVESAFPCVEVVCMWQLCNFVLPCCREN